MCELCGWGGEVCVYVDVTGLTRSTLHYTVCDCVGAQHLYLMLLFKKVFNRR